MNDNALYEFAKRLGDLIIGAARIDRFGEIVHDSKIMLLRRRMSSQRDPHSRKRR
jgi:hypothetical protein